MISSISSKALEIVKKQKGEICKSTFVVLNASAYDINK